MKRNVLMLNVEVSIIADMSEWRYGPCFCGTFFSLSDLEINFCLMITGPVQSLFTLGRKF